MAKKKKNKKKDETERFNKEKAMTTRLIDDFEQRRKSWKRKK